MINLKEVLSEVKKWAREVGEFQSMKSRENDFGIETKSSEIDLVTEVDNRSEEMIIEKIEKNFSEHSILGEEGGSVDKESEYTWIIDPIDGTNNYANGYPLYCVSIALEHKGEIVLGVVYLPKLDEMFSAVKESGAYLNGEEITVSKCKKLGNTLVSTGFPYDKVSAKIDNIKHFNKILMEVRGVRRSGTAAFDLCNVAAGRIDGLWEFKLKPWDIAAGKLFVREAGGKVIEKNIDNVPLIVAGNENICNQLAEMIDNIKI
jgi:myo-inositol-1(or 4)-monophosphatase